MFLSPWIDDTIEEVSILGWPKPEEGDGIEVDGLNIKSKETGSVGWYENTTQPIPRQIMSFVYSGTIVSMDKFGNDHLRLESGDKQLTHGLKSGQIKYDGTHITTFKGLDVNDTLQFSLRRLILESHTFNLVKIKVNEEECASELILDGPDVYPGVYIGSTGLEINTTFSLKETQGKEGMFKNFFTN